jgi:hypothetical protein
MEMLHTVTLELFHLVYQSSLLLIWYNGYELDDWGVGVQFPTGVRDSSLLCSIQTGSGPTQPAIQQILGFVSLGLKQQGHEADHSPLSVKVKNGGGISSLPHTSSWSGA